MKPTAESTVYLKFGFVKTRITQYHCPACAYILNAGPDYTPKFCSECGQKLDFSGIVFEDEEELGYVDRWAEA